MAFPFLTENGFEAGAIGHFDAISPDPFTRAFYYHYSQLAKIPGLPAPFRGAYCFGVNLATNTTDHYLQETGSWDIALAAAAMFWRFMFYLSPNTVMANGDEFAIWQLWSGTNTVEAGCYVNYTTANGYRLGLGKDIAAASVFLGLKTGEWNCIELKFTSDTSGAGANDDAKLDGWLNGTAFTQVAGTYDVAAITSGVIGVIGQDATTTAGYALFDDIIADDLQIFPPTFRFKTDILLTGSGHAFVGNGRIENVSLMSGAGTDCVVQVFDTDTGNTSDASKMVLELKNTANNELVDPAGVPTDVQRGCYVSLAGTNPRAMVKFSHTPAYGSDGAIRSYGARRRELAGNI